MASPLVTLIPFFALVLIGYASARGGLLSAEGTKGLNAYIFFFALPALLFDKTQGAPVDKLLAEKAYLLAYLIAALGVFAATWIGARLIFKCGPGSAAVMGLGGVYGNIGFMGIPVMTAAVGDWVAVPMALIVLIDVAIMVPLATTIIDMTRPDETRRKLGPAVFASVVKNPVVLATLAGLTVALVGLSLPSPVTTFTDLLGRSAGPAAMFTLGAVLAGRPLAEGFSEAAFASAVKLGVFPLAVWGVMGGMGIGADWRLAATLASAMPMATVLFVVAQQYDVMPQRASSAVLLSTVLAMGTVTALMAFMPPLP